PITIQLQHQKGGQFAAKNTGQFVAKRGGQFTTKKGGHFTRNLQGLNNPNMGIGGAGSATLPGAYMQFMVYDDLDQFQFGGYTRISEAANFAKEKVTRPTITIEKPGFIYIFLYNASNSANFVYWDDLKITHQHSPIVAGADYYPFGLPQVGREIKEEKYKYGYQGQYSERDSLTQYNEFELRFYDARIGRFTTVDPYGQFYSGYMAMGNNPQMGVDPDGGWNFWTGLAGAAIGAGVGYAITGDLEGAVTGGVIGGFIGAASFKHDVKFVSAGSQTNALIPEKSLALSTFGNAIKDNAPSLFSNYLNNFSSSFSNFKNDINQKTGLVNPLNANSNLKYALASNNVGCCPGLVMELASNPAVTRVVSRTATRTGAGWLIGLSEPTVAGEIVMTGVTISVFAVEVYNVIEQMNSVHHNQVVINKMTAEEWIGKYCKGSIRSEFPEEFLDWTLDQIKAEAQKGNARAKKAWKLLNDKRFRK
ncbi:MAG: hypothetical protein O9340_12895, partial [Cyclobacteriaceae bacterium]|nr:hypothetical protein [Cyclobacteriaceae bacterium]